MTSSTSLTWNLVRVSDPTLASCVRICILRSPGDSYAPSSLISELFADQGEGKVYLLSFHLGRSGFWMSRCCCRRSSTSCGASSLLYMGLVPSGDLRGLQPTWLLKDPIHSFSSDFQENKTKQKRTIPKLCFLVNPYGCSHPFEQNRLSWCYWETTGKGGRVASHDRSPSPWVPSWLLGSLWWGCWWRSFSRALVWGDSNIDVIEKTPRFTTKFYRLDTILLRRELSLQTVVLLARIQGTWVVKIRVSPSGLLHGAITSAACCGGGSWDQAQ